MVSRCVYYCTIGILCLFTTPQWIKAQNDEPKYIPYEGQRYDAFDWNLMKALQSPDFGNVLVSPLSIKMVLGMLYEGASGATERELEMVLQLPMNKQALRERFQQIIRSLMSSSNDHTLDMGSRVFLDETVEPQQRFASVLKEFYDTDVKAVDFSNKPAAREEINSWAGNITHGRVRELVNQNDLEDAIMVIANALYYKGLWRTPFNRTNTEYGGFYINPQRTVPVPYMYNYGRYYYAESNELDAKLLRLPFKGSHISMFIVLPNSKSGLVRVIKKMNMQDLKRQVWLMDINNVHVYFPKFSFEFNAKLGRILQKLGLQQIFQNTASLPGISRGNGKGGSRKLLVSNIIQKAGIEVNEEGSTAWAATEATLGNRFGSSGDVIFNASNPFMYYIEDEFTGTVLFMGKIENPAQKEEVPFPEELSAPNRAGLLNQGPPAPSVTERPREDPLLPSGMPKGASNPLVR